MYVGFGGWGGEEQILGYLKEVWCLPVNLHPQEGQLVVGGGVEGLVVAGIDLLSPVAAHQLPPKAHCNLL